MDYRYAEPLAEGVLVRRYKRFLADVELDDGSVLTVHCANPGSMKSCSEPGRRVRISDSGNPKRKLRHTLEQIRMGRTWVGVNTAVPNPAVAAAVERGAIPSLAGYPRLEREVADGNGSRFDLRLSGRDRPCWIEIKNTTLREGAEARFPDAQTERGRKHLAGLAALAAAGDRAVQLYVVSRGDVRTFRPAWDIDPAYGAALGAAVDGGVEVIAVRARYTQRGARLDDELPILFDAPPTP